MWPLTRQMKPDSLRGECDVPQARLHTYHKLTILLKISLALLEPSALLMATLAIEAHATRNRYDLIL